MNRVNNQGRFRELLNNGETGSFIRKGLEGSSVSAMDAENRVKSWDKVFSNLDEIVEDRMYATHGGSAYGGAPAGAGSPGMSGAGLHGVEFFDATVAAMIKSYAGFFCIERSMNQPNASLPFMNLYGVKTGNLLTPNIGVSNTFEEGDGYIKQEGKASAGAGPLAFTWSTTDKFLGGATAPVMDKIGINPGTVKIKVKIASVNGGKEFNIMDDGLGGLLAPAGLITTGAVSYGLSDLEPEITFTVAAGAVVATDTVEVSYIQDSPKDLNEKIKPELGYYHAVTSPVIVPYELNQVANLSAKKALGIDMRALTLGQITDEYTKIINKRVTNAFKILNPTSEYTIALGAFTIATSDYRTYLEAFMAQLKQLDTIMAKKTEKGVKITAYLVGLQVGDIFSQLELVTTKWVSNKDISYVDDVVGYYDGIPVVRSKWLEEDEGYAIHKTKEGQLAPLMRGIFLP